MTETSTLQKALYTIKKLKQLLENQQEKTAQPIAIVGLSCRLPQANNKYDFWQLLTEGRNVISPLPEKRWQQLKGTHELSLRDPNHPYWGGYLTDIAAFDAYFFGISPREAIRMDPQHRLLLEVTYEAIEDAGMPVETLAGSNTGVFASLNNSQLAHLQEMEADLDALYLPTGNAISIAANRLSYLLDLYGPSMVIDSACSASLLAVHLACLHIQTKQCDAALVCGARLGLLPYVNFVMSKAMLSPDGQCKTFDAGANGYVPGEGVGAVVLKPLHKALQDGDRIYAVIAGTGANQDGKTNGLTAPNGLQQEKLLREVYRTAKINPLTVSYVECHGTGTFLGDPIELQALGEVMGKHRDPENPCWIGSVKTNIGHLEPAAGIMSIIKVALALKHSQIPPHLNFSIPNPHIPFDKYHFQIPLQIENWPKYGDYRIAGISSFGFGGTNSHIVLQEFNEVNNVNTTNKIEKSPDKKELFTLSAKDPNALKQLVARWCHYLEQNLSADFAQICYCTHVRRSHYNHRLAIIASNLTELYKACCFARDNSLENLPSSANYFTKNNSIDPTLVAAYKNKNEELLRLFTDKSTDHNNLITIAKLYVNNFNMPWRMLEQTRKFTHIDMPLYHWQHKDYWPNLILQKNMDDTADHYPLNGKQLPSPLKTLQFEFRIDSKKIPDIQDTYNILHVGYYLEMLAYAIKQLYKKSDFTVEDFSFLSPLIAPQGIVMPVQLILEPLEDNLFSFCFFSNNAQQKNWVEHAKGKISPQIQPAEKKETIADIKNRCHTHENAETLYKRVIAMGMPAGPSIRWSKRYWLNKNEILCEFQPPAFPNKNEDFVLQIHPGIFDGCIQPLFRLLPDDFITPYIASHIAKLTYHGIKNDNLYLLAVLNELDEHNKKIIGDCYLITEDGTVISAATGLCLTQLNNQVQIEKLMQLSADHDLDLSKLPKHERKSKIISFLIDQIVVIFAMPKEDINPDHSLLDMGMDSLMGLVLMRVIETTWKKSYSLQDLLQGPSINDIADFVLTDYQDNPDVKPEAKIVQNRWLAYRQPQNNTKMRLFCFPYGGAGASIYREWQKQLPDTIEICPVQLPGRENRMDESPIQDINYLIPLLADNIRNDLGVPFAFFGHSFGSLLAFELARYLRKNKLPEPKHLFASAFPNPRTPARSLDNLINQLRENQLNLFELDFNSLSDIQFNTLSNIFGENGVADYNSEAMDKEILKVLLPVFISDMNLVKSYTYYDETPLNLPVTLFSGKNDAWVTAQDRAGWEKHTQKQFTLHEFDSGHLFIRESRYREEMLQKIQIALLD